MLKVRITGADKIKQNIAYLRREFPEWLSAANLETAYEIRDLAQRNVRQLDAFDTGELYNSFVVTISPQGLSVGVASKSPYAPYVEFGTRPHFPPLEPIRRWCISRGLPASAAFPIARAISERGTPERPFLYPAFKVGMRNHIQRIRKYVSLGLKGKLAA
jgi:Bacteriophage HK97-gp10, putative tail-component